MSSGVQRASAATLTDTSRPTARTASKSPSDAIGKPASRTSTPELGQLVRHAHLLGHGHAAAGRLLAVAQGGVEDGRPGRSRSSGDGAVEPRIRQIYISALDHNVYLSDKASLMELYSLQVFRAVVTERSFSRAAEKLLRTQPAVSLSLQRLEAELGEKLIDRIGARPGPDRRRAHGARVRAPLREPAPGAGQRAGRAARQGRRPPDDRRQRIVDAVPAAAHRALPPPLPQGQGAGAAQPVEQDPERAPRRQPRAGRGQLRSRPTTASSPRSSTPTRWPSSCRPSTASRGARRCRSPSSAWRRSSRTTWSRPTARWCVREFRRHKVPLNMDVEMPTLETIRKLVQSNEGVAFLPTHVRAARGRAQRRLRGQGQGAARRADDPPAARQGAHAQPRGAGLPGRRAGTVPEADAAALRLRRPPLP